MKWDSNDGVQDSLLKCLLTISNLGLSCRISITAVLGSTITFRYTFLFKPSEYIENHRTGHSRSEAA